MKRALAAAVLSFLTSATLYRAEAADAPPPPVDNSVVGYTDTPMLPDGKWRVHDAARPKPPVVVPGACAETPCAPPSDAVVLFGGADLSKWKAGNGQPSGWLVKDGYMQVPPKKTPNGGEISTVDEFGDIQLHLEFATPEPPPGKGQAGGNSGVYFMGRYELQVLNGFENPTYADGQGGALYGMYPPLVNPSRKPGEWQTYDAVFIAPRFDGDKLVSPAKMTVFFNGVLVHHDQALIGISTHKSLATYRPHGPTGPIKLQDHGDAVRYRNIWVRPLKGYDSGAGT
jgi:hypothetical protein